MSQDTKILIIEDEAMLLDMLVETFKKRGFDVQKATNGEDGLKIALKDPPNVILLDLTMPVMDGVTMLKKLRGDDRGKNLKVIVLTNLDNVADATKTANLGILDYIVKADWDIDDIVDRVSEKIQ